MARFLRDADPSVPRSGGTNNNPVMRMGRHVSGATLFLMANCGQAMPAFPMVYMKMVANTGTVIATQKARQIFALDLTTSRWDVLLEADQIR